jgi:hypothetical protein
MTTKRFAACVAVAFVVSQLLAVVVHGFILAKDYEPFYGTLLRSFDGPSWQMLLLPLAHLSFVWALVWIYAHVQLKGTSVAQGLKIGVLGWTVGQVPLWLRWSAEQPWPDDLVVKQLSLELLSSLILGVSIALVAGQVHENRPASFTGIAAGRS